jgi:hypothetical protein
VLGELALHEVHLATAAQAAASAHGVHIDPEGTSSGEERCADRKAAALAGRGEDDEGVS